MKVIMHHTHIINLDNAVTLLRLSVYRNQLSGPEKDQLNLAIARAVKKIDQDVGELGFDTAAAFQEFFGRPLVRGTTYHE